MLESARQALTLVARWCRSQHIELAVLPAYHCSAMALPFWLEGMRVQFVEVDDSLQASPEALGRLLASCGERALVVATRVGAVPRSSALTATLQKAHRSGHLWLEDATHSLLDDLLTARPRPGSHGSEDTPSDDDPDVRSGTELSTWPPEADLVIASLRKLIPVTDGALLWTRSSIHTAAPGRRAKIDEQLVASRTNLLTRAAWLRAHTPVPPTDTPDAQPPAIAADYLAALGNSEEFFDRAQSPVPMSHGATSQLRAFTLLTQARRLRTANRSFQRALAEANPTDTAGPGDSGNSERADAIGMLNPGRACFALLRSHMAERIEGELASCGIFSPQSWARPDYLPAEFRWPTDVVSIDLGSGDINGRAARIAHIVAHVLIQAVQ